MDEIDKHQPKNLYRETAALIVRNYQKEDADLWLHAQNNAEANNRDFIRELQWMKEQMRIGKSYFFATFTKNDNKLLSTTSLTELIRGSYQSAFLSYATFPKQVGDNYSLETIIATCEMAFEDLRLHRVEALVEKNKLDFKGLMVKCGFRYEGVRKGAFLIQEKWQDMEVFAMTADDWKTKHLQQLKMASTALR